MVRIDSEWLSDVAAGAAILGSGGGGDTAVPLLMAQRALHLHGPVDVISLESVPDDAWLIPPAIVGAPTVTLEKLPSGTEAAQAFRMLERYLGVQAFAAYPSEIGGGNALIPVLAATELRIPLLDADMMGRAFPEVQMTTAAMHGVSAWPMSMADEKGNAVIVEASDNRMAERLARAISVASGGTSHICNYSMQGAAAKQCLIGGSMSRAAAIGKTLRSCRAEKRGPSEAVCRVTGGKVVGSGKIRDVQRSTEKGFAVGQVSISGSEEFAGQQFRIAFQNENLIVWQGDRAVVTTPDLISIVDEATGAAISTERLKYGQRVAILGIPCDKKWQTPQGIALAGPRYFGFDLEYLPIGAIHE